MEHFPTINFTFDFQGINKGLEPDAGECMISW